MRLLFKKHIVPKVMYNKIVPKVLTISIKSGIFIVSKVTKIKKGTERGYRLCVIHLAIVEYQERHRT